MFLWPVSKAKKNDSIRFMPLFVAFCRKGRIYFDPLLNLCYTFFNIHNLNSGFVRFQSRQNSEIAFFER